MSDAAASTLAPGTRVGGRFVLERLLRGSVLCEVYLARSEGGGTARFEVRRIAGAAPPGAELSVRRELERVAAAGCRAIPALVGVEIDPAGLLVITEAPEALAPRDTLRDVLTRDQKLPPAEALRILREVARALDAIHGLVPQVVHRALCPENILLMDRRRKVWVTECGLAHALFAAGAVSPRSAVVETAYSSPDDLLNRATTRGDIFSLATLCFEVLTGRAPFQGGSAATTESALLRGARPGVGEALAPHAERVDEVLSRAWSSDAQTGFARASELISALERATEVGGSTTVPLSSRTMIGIGAPSTKAGPVAPRPGVPRAAPAPPSVTEAELEAGRATPRALPPTQKVQVPRIHPPGTQPVLPVAPAGDAIAESPPRPVTPPRSSIAPPDPQEVTKPVRIDPPPEAKGDIFAEVTRPALSDPPRDSWGAVFDTRLPEQESTAVLPRAQASVVPADESPTLVPPSEDQVETVGAATAAISSRPPPAPSVPPPSVPPLPPPAASSPPPQMDMSPEETIEPSAETDFDLTSEPLVPEAEELLVVEDVPAPSAPPPSPVLSRPPPPPSAAIRASEPSMPPLMGPPSSTPVPMLSTPPRSPDETQPETPELVQLATLPSLFDATDDVPSVPPSVSDVASLRPAERLAEATHERVPGAAPQRSAYPELTPARADTVLEARTPASRKGGPMWAVAGAVLLFVAAGAAGGWWYLTQREGMTPQPPPAAEPVVVAPQPTTDVVAAVVDAAVRAAVPVDAAVPLDAPLADLPGPTDAAAHEDVQDAARVVDASVAAVAVDGASAGLAAAVTVGGEVAPVITREPMRGHPRNRESRALEEAMYDDVLRCAAGTHRRRVRVAVRYLGATGRAEEIHVGAPFNEGTVAACIEAVVRRHPVGRFTSEDWETYFIFDPDED
jgi:serine/threonine protein kinase